MFFLMHFLLFHPSQQAQQRFPCTSLPHLSIGIVVLPPLDPRLFCFAKPSSLTFSKLQPHSLISFYLLDLAEKPFVPLSLGQPPGSLSRFFPRCDLWDFLIKLTCFVAFAPPLGCIRFHQSGVHPTTRAFLPFSQVLILFPLVLSFLVSGGRA